jgi:hypothetical protein
MKCSAGVGLRRNKVEPWPRPIGRRLFWPGHGRLLCRSGRRTG